MNNEQPTEQQEAYFAPAAFGLARIGAIAIRHDLDELQSVADMAADRFELVDRIEVDEAVLLYRIARGGFRGRSADPSVHKASAYAAYIPADQLALPVDELPRSVTKARVLAQGKPLQMDVTTFDRPLVEAYARSLVFFPPAEDLRLIASPGAWLRQTRQAFAFLSSGITDTPASRQRLIDEVLQHYPDAIRLEPRQSAAAQE